MVEFGRLLTAMVTPFAETSEVDYEKAARLAQRLLDTGSEGIVVAGTTGESPTLTNEEKLALFRTITEAVGDAAAVIAGTGSNNTRASVELTKAAEATGVDGAMLVGPYYNKPPQEGLYQHFRTVAEATRLPVIVYNVPSRTSRNIDPATVVRLAQDVPNIVAVKEAPAGMENASELCAAVPEGFLVYSGDDSVYLPMLAVGGHGVISVASHVCGPQMAEMTQRFLAGDGPAAARIHQRLFPVFRALFPPTSVNPAPVKSALRLTGFDPGGVRLPLVETTAADLERLRAAMDAAGLLAEQPVEA